MMEDDNSPVVDVVTQSIIRTNEIAAELAAASRRLSSVIAAQQRDDNRKRIKDFVTTVGVIILVAVVIALLIGRQNDSNAAEERSALNRDRLSCVSTITTSFQTSLGVEQLAAGDVTIRLGELLLVAGAGGSPTSEPYQQAFRAYGDSITVLKTAQESLAFSNALLQEIPTKCYGDKPNPNPSTARK